MRLNPTLLGGATAIACACVAAPAHAQEVSVTLASRYMDVTNFNGVYSNEPTLQLDASYDLSEHVYVSGYVYSGFTEPLRDRSSEYGAEIGGKWNLDSTTELKLGVGRYSNYEGEGFGNGDWYAKATLTHGRATVAVSALSGVSDTVLIDVIYDLPIGKKLTISPSIAYFTRDSVVNPALGVTYQANDHLSFGARFVLPKEEDGPRKLYAGVFVSYSF